MKSLILEKLKLTSEELLNRNEMKDILGGSGMSYCAEMYMIRSCNELDDAQMAGFQYGWTSNGCNSSGGANYWEEVSLEGISMDDCDTSWYSY
ncbi:hypothetical protein [Algoriphagus hitonicola]|uniref:Natural product n=1 Tax=Algoriphagus hitonicola TaxID=435880 RepID=A0A1I2W3T0_9BACT|nr:hypothetical protein [Algoriphagus hitonicola]SFG96040.1 hypothetical protein SAMN04487988_111135 [Algoriphagus hitonicola]